MILAAPQRKWSYYVLAIWVLLIVYFTCIEQVWAQTGYHAIISWDVWGYYIYLPAHFIYHDVLHVKFLPELMDKYHPSSYVYQAFPLPNGNYYMNYTMGLSFLFLPFFLMGHLAANLLHVPADGLSWPYQLAIHLCGTFYSLLGLYFARKVLLRFFTESFTAVTLLLLIVATNFFHYGLFETGMQHIYIFFLYALLLWFTIKWHDEAKWYYAVAIGLTIGQMTLMRPTEFIAFLIPLLWNVTNKESLKQKWNLVLAHRSQLLLCIACVMVMGLPQIIYWKIATDHFLFYSYGKVRFSFDNPHIGDGLYSWRKGWLMYTPIMLFSLLGYVFMYRDYRHAFWGFTVFLILNIYLIFSWSVWWYGGGFGARPMVQSYAIMILPLGMFLQWASKRKFTVIIMSVIGVACIFLNVFQDWQFRNNIFSTEGLSKYVYGVTFLQTKMEKAVLYQYDNAKVPSKDVKFKSIALFEKTDWGSKSPYSFDDSSALELDYKKTDTLYSSTITNITGAHDGDWVTVKAKGFFTDYQWEYRNMALLRADFKHHDGNSFHYTKIRLQHLIGNDTIQNSNDLFGRPNTWGEVMLYIKLPEHLQPDDVLTITAYNPEYTKVYLDDVKVELFSKQ